MKNQAYNVFWQRIHKHAREKHFPLVVMFELTYRCNFFCGHCYVPLSYREKSKEGELKTKEVFSLLNQLKDIGCLYLGFTGGEPFIREDILEILWYAKRCGFELIIYTNGSLINGKIARELRNLRPNKVDITIPAMSKGAFERISGVAGSWDKVFNAIDLLYKNRVNLGFKTCVLKESESEIEEIENFAHSLGALHRLGNMLWPCLDGSKEPYRYRGKLGSLSSLGSLGLVASGKERDLTKLTKPTKITNSTELTELPFGHKLFKCGSGRSQAIITPLGELKICLTIDYPKYKIFDTSLRDAWKKLKESVASITPDENYQCDKCELEPYCNWCPAKGWLENRNFMTCDPESRRWAEIGKQRLENSEK